MRGAREPLLELSSKPIRILKKARGESAKDSACDMGHIGYSACLGCCYHSDVEKLQQEPNPDENSRRDKSDAHEDEDDQKGPNLIVRVSNEERAHDSGNRSAGTQVGNGRVRAYRHLG